MSKEVDQNKLETGAGGGGLAGNKREGVVVGGVSVGDNLSITCAPQLSAVLARRAHVERSVRGTEVLVRAGAQWGRGGVPSATTTPHPLS